MYMFIQGRLWQDTGGSPPREAPGGGAGGAGVLSLAPLLPPPSPPRPQEPAAPCPELSALTPVPRGSSQVTFALSPTPRGEGARSSQALSLAIVHPSGPDPRDAALYR